MSDAKSKEAEDPQTESGSNGSAPTRSRAAMNLGLASVLVIAIAGMANFLAFRNYTSWDLTTDRVHTLSDRTEQVLADLTVPVDIYVLMSSSEPDAEPVFTLTNQYGAASSKVEVTRVDPDRAPGEFARIAQRFNMSVGMFEGGRAASDVAIAIESGERQWKIDRTDLVEISGDSFDAEDGFKEMDVKSEQAITGGILEVVQGEDTKICVTRGHGEWELTGSAERGLFALDGRLRRENFVLASISTRGVEAIEASCDTVYVIGPTTAFDRSEAALLSKFVEEGGSVLIALDPILDGGVIKPTGLEGFARELGVRIDPSIVLELSPAHLLSRNPFEGVAVSSYSDHEIVRTMKSGEIPTLMQLMRSVRPIDGSGAETLLASSAMAYGDLEPDWIERDEDPTRGPEDIEGPVSLAVARELPSEGDERAGRLVIIGDTDWITAIEDPRYGNNLLIDAFTGWLTHRTAMIEIPPRRIATRAFALTEEDLDYLGLRVIVFIPLAAMLLGAAVWYIRRD